MLRNYNRGRQSESERYLFDYRNQGVGRLRRSDLPFLLGSWEIERYSENLVFVLRVDTPTRTTWEVSLTNKSTTHDTLRTCYKSCRKYRSVRHKSGVEMVRVSCTRPYLIRDGWGTEVILSCIHIIGGRVSSACSTLLRYPHFTNRCSWVIYYYTNHLRLSILSEYVISYGNILFYSIWHKNRKIPINLLSRLFINNI